MRTIPLNATLRFAKLMTENAKAKRVRDAESKRMQAIELERGYIFATTQELAQICRDHGCKKNAARLELSSDTRKFIWALNYNTVWKCIEFAPVDGQKTYSSDN